MARVWNRNFPSLSSEVLWVLQPLSFVVYFSDNQVFPWQPSMDEQVEVACSDSGLRPARAFSSVYKVFPIQTAYNPLSLPSFSHWVVFSGGPVRELAGTSCPHKVQLSHQLHVVRTTQLFQFQHVTRKALIGYLKVKSNDGFYCISHVT